METHINELPDSPLGVLRLFEISQTGIDHFSDGLIGEVQNGNLNPLELKAMIKSLEMILERTDKATKDNQLRAADLFPGDSFEAYGVKFTKGDVYTSYDYSVCNDPDWSRLSEYIKNTTKELKDRESFLKTVKKPLAIVTDDGELVTINPPNKKSTPGLKLQIK